MKLLYTLRTAATQIALPLAIAAALVPTSAGAQSGAEEPRQVTEKETAEAKALKAALEPTFLLIKADLAYSKREYVEALAIYKSVSEMNKGSSEAALANIRIAEINLFGKGVTANENEAIKYYKMATIPYKYGSNLFYDQAKYELGNIYYNNENYTEAIKYYNSISNGGREFANAQYKLGIMFKNGNGVTQDYTLAAKAFEYANSESYTPARGRYELGMLYLEGKGVVKNYSTAATYLKQAADGNENNEERDTDAQYVLSTLYGAGKGVAQSDAEAVSYLRMAAKRDHTKAQFGLGVMYTMGKGVPQELSIGYLWIARAAEGDASTRGLSDISKAAIGAENGTAQAIAARNSIRTRLTPEQIAGGQALVDRCIADRDACNWGE